MDRITIDIKAEQPCPSLFLNIKPLRLSLGALKKKFEQILESEGFTLDDIKAATLEFRFTEPDDYTSYCCAEIRTNAGKTFIHEVNCLGQTISPNHRLHRVREARSGGEKL